MARAGEGEGGIIQLHSCSDVLRMSSTYQELVLCTSNEDVLGTRTSTERIMNHARERVVHVVLVRVLIRVCSRYWYSYNMRQQSFFD